jgi:hypothetical protein
MLAMLTSMHELMKLSNTWIQGGLLLIRKHYGEFMALMSDNYPPGMHLELHLSGRRTDDSLPHYIKNSNMRQ